MYWEFADESLVGCTSHVSCYIVMSATRADGTQLVEVHWCLLAHRNG